MKGFVFVPLLLIVLLRSATSDKSVTNKGILGIPSDNNIERKRRLQNRQGDKRSPSVRRALKQETHDARRLPFNNMYYAKEPVKIPIVKGFWHGMVAASGSSKGKGGKGGKKSSKGTKGKGGSHYEEEYYYYDDVVEGDDELVVVDDAVVVIDDEYTDDAVPAGCEIVAFNETFVVPVASLYLAPDTTVAEPGTPELPGTLFIFQSNNILEPDGVTPIKGTRIAGTCTRAATGSDGGGICSLVFIDDEDFTINVDGYLQGPLGGPLAISGGTGGMVGVIGEMDFFPIYKNATGINGDIFLDPDRYEVIADLGLIVCP